MEREPGQDPEHDGPADPQPGEGSPGPDDAGLRDDAGVRADAGLPPVPVPVPVPVSGAGASGTAADDDAGTDADADDDGVSVFGPWDGLEGTLGAAREREELLSGFAPDGVWDKHPPGPGAGRRPGPGGRAGLAVRGRRPARS